MRSSLYEKPRPLGEPCHGCWEADPVRREGYIAKISRRGAP